MTSPEEHHQPKSGRLFQHPAVMQPAFRRMIQATATLTAIQLLWAAGIFYVGSMEPDLILLPGEPAIAAEQNRITDPMKAQQRPVLYRPLVIYAMYSMLHGFYVLLACGMARFLSSRGWLKTALYFAGLPSPGFLFGLFQVPLALYFLRALREPGWEEFFQWQARLQSSNDLTPGQRHQK
ncbi:MAG: hypothetical protein KDK25_10380 [Leptospiraceae bacterium]|nr:hypothetical protein [Leptospiraceae bacterium]MCB1170733.1 hypothetical protein [Leptospiraceae bacterium]